MGSSDPKPGEPPGVPPLLSIIRAIVLFGLGGFLIIDYAVGRVGRDVELIAGLILVGVVPIEELIARYKRNGHAKD